jgi:hypothetical protein
LRHAVRPVACLASRRDAVQTEARTPTGFEQRRHPSERGAEPSRLIGAEAADGLTKQSSGFLGMSEGRLRKQLLGSRQEASRGTIAVEHHG